MCTLSVRLKQTIIANNVWFLYVWWLLQQSATAKADLCQSNMVTGVFGYMTAN